MVEDNELTFGNFNREATRDLFLKSSQISMNLQHRNGKKILRLLTNPKRNFLSDSSQQISAGENINNSADTANGTSTGDNTTVLPGTSNQENQDEHQVQSFQSIPNVSFPSQPAPLVQRVSKKKKISIFTTIS